MDQLDSRDRNTHPDWDVTRDAACTEFTRKTVIQGLAASLLPHVDGSSHSQHIAG